MNEKKCLKTSEVALEFGVSHDCITDWIKSGKLKAYRTHGGHYRIPKDAVESLKEELLYRPVAQEALPEKPNLSVSPYFDDLPEKPFPKILAMPGSMTQASDQNILVVPSRDKQKKELDVVQGMIQDYCEERGIMLGGPDETSEGE